MAETTGIAWCDMTFNPWIGCAKVSAGCANCYAEREFDHRYGKAKWGPVGTRVLTSDANWAKPMKWNRQAACCCRKEPGDLEHDAGCPQRQRPRVFCASLADIFEEWNGPILNSKGNAIHKHNGNWFAHVPLTYVSSNSVTMADVRERLFHVIDSTPHLDWLLLTKRPENIQRMWAEKNGRGWLDDPRPNVWLGTTCENQDMADKRVPELLKCKPLASKLFLSCEPLLGPLDLQQAHRTKERLPNWPEPTRVDWVINGAESGPGARPSKLEWHESIVSQCKAAGVPVFVKQLVIDGKMVKEVDQFPESLRVQEFPA